MDDTNPETTEASESPTFIPFPGPTQAAIEENPAPADATPPAPNAAAPLPMPEVIEVTEADRMVASELFILAIAGGRPLADRQQNAAELIARHRVASALHIADQVSQTAMAWAGLTLYLLRVKSALQHVVLRAEVHPPSKGRHNERLLVFADRVHALAEVLEQMPRGHAEAAEWWKLREERLAELEELVPIVAMVEREFRGAPAGAAQHTLVEKVGGMLQGMMGVVRKQQEQIQRLEAALKRRVTR